MRTQGYGAQSLSRLGFWSTGKRANSPLRRGSLFSAWSWTRSTSQHVSQRACAVNAELPGVFPAQEGGSTETHSEAPGAYGIRSRSRCHATRIGSYETASALASRPGPEMGMAPRHTGSQSPRPAAIPSAHGRTLLFLGRSSPSASIQACCCNDRCLYHGLGGHVQRACSCRGSGQGPSCSGISIA